jgi:hypothetical protein
VCQARQKHKVTRPIKPLNLSKSMAGRVITQPERAQSCESAGEISAASILPVHVRGLFAADLLEEIPVKHEELLKLPNWLAYDAKSDPCAEETKPSTVDIFYICNMYKSLRVINGCCIDAAWA